jgi:hypothetical protein
MICGLVWIMTIMRKTLVTVTMVATVGMGIYEARQATILRLQVQTLRQKQSSLSEEIRQLQHQRYDAIKSEENVAGILADKNFRVVLHTLEQRTGVETLGEPEVTTTSGREIQGQFVNVVFPVVTNPAPFAIQHQAE